MVLFYMFKYEKKSIERAVKSLVSGVKNNLIAVIAFGSRIRGDFTEDSDLDILVLVKSRSCGLVRKVITIFLEEEKKTDVFYGVVVKDMAAFERERSLNSGFYRNIKKEGVVFYDRSEQRR